MDPDTARLADDIQQFISAGDTEERATSRLRGYGVPAERITQALRLYGERVGRIRDLRDPRVLLANELRTGGWYGGPQAGDIFWPAFQARLGFDDTALASVDNRSSRIVSLLSRPGADEIRTRGLVLGHVQSGKTTSFMSVIAKGADAGYRMFIVLSGITDSLRSQTQARLDELLVGAEPEQRTRWRWLTEPDQDFAYSAFYAPNMLRDDGSRIVAVVKKNPYRLRRLATFLEGAGQPILRSCPILLIDDEADQATINVAQQARVSRINALIRRILSQPKVGYIAYTATPFANLLINPTDYEDLYPRNFIVDLKPPQDYFGAEKIFGRAPLDATDDSADDGLDTVRPVSDVDVAAVRPASRSAMARWTASVPDSLEEALRWFVLATAARRARDGRTSHSTMLVHTSMLTAAHSALQQSIQPYLNSLGRAVSSGSPVLEALEQQWADETSRVPAAVFELAEVQWTEVRANLAAVLVDLRVVVDNYQSTDRLSYPHDDPQTIVAIGGNTLSRGLTLEGLVCSYFVRSANAYDTLLQMGRWFGYRPGYGDLVRIWMTADLEGWFFDLATVEAEIRQQIARYEAEDLTPEQLPVKIRTHPAMVVTAAAKMRDSVVTNISYGGQREQTILFNHRDATWLGDNIRATAQLFDSAEAAGASAERGALGGIVYRNIPVEVITTFLSTYRFHERAERLKPDLLTGYIELQNRHNSLLTWNIAVISADASGGSRSRPIGTQQLNLITRTRLAMPGITHANIKALVSRIDRAADLPLPRDEITRLATDDSDEAYATLRHDYYDRIGLLCIYPIARDSRPRAGRAGTSPGYKPRLPLDAVDDVVGVGLFFPDDKSDTPYQYVSADLSGLAIDTDEPDIDLLDREDEQVGLAQEAAADQRSGSAPR